MNDYDKHIYEQFKLYNRIKDDEVDRWEPSLANSITVYMKNGDIIEYDDVCRSIRYHRSYDRDEFGNYIMSDKEYKKEFASNLWRIMTSQRINQKTLSDLTGISTVSINHYINGRNLPDLMNTLRICKVLNCSIEELTNFI